MHCTLISSQKESHDLIFMSKHGEKLRGNLKVNESLSGVVNMMQRSF